MKKVLLATIAALLSVGLLDARRCGWNRCRTSMCNPAPACSEECPPKCYKTVQVPYTAYRCEQVEVAPIKELIPVADTCEYIPQPPIKIVTKNPPIPVPDTITYKCVPDKCKITKNPPLVRYKCPADCTPC